MIYISGPGHGGPALVGNTYLERYLQWDLPWHSQDEDGLKKLFHHSHFREGSQAMFRPSATVSIHEGGELDIH